MINYNLKIDTDGEKTFVSDISFVSGDVGAYKLTFEFFNNGKVMDISNYLLVVRTIRADGVCIVGSGEIVDNKGIFIPQNSMYAVPGEIVLEIALTDNAKNYITTKIIVADVIEGLGTECKPQESEVSVFVTLMSRIQSKIEEANELIKRSVPKKGTDYWTEEDKAEIKAYVDEAIVGGAW